jgi:hypothetical protein
MEIKIVNISDVIEKPSYFFKPYSIKYHLEIVTGSGFKQRTLSIPLKKYFDNNERANLFMQRHDLEKYKAMVKERREQERQLEVVQSVAR